MAGRLTVGLPRAKGLPAIFPGSACRSVSLQNFIDVVERALLHFGVYLSDIGAGDAEGDEDEAAHEPDGDHQRCPTGFHGAEYQRPRHVEAYREGDDEE